jgi:hypothetical protein
MATDRRKPPSTDFGMPNFPGERVPGTHAVEKNTESVWALFNNLSAAPDAPPAASKPEAGTRPSAGQRTAAPPAPGIDGDPRYADTQPLTEPAVLSRSKPPVSFTASPATVAEAMVEARRNNRVCPQPELWQRLYSILPVKKTNDPLPPPLGAAWNETPSLSKRTILRAQIEWAAANGTLNSVLLFMRRLPEDQWVHMGD